MDTISYNDFKKLDIRVVKVTRAERIPNKTKILKLTIDVGSGEPKTIIAGGAEFYAPQHFEGKKFVALVNLAPKKIGNIVSQGMLLAAVSGDKPLWLTVTEVAPIGAKVI